MTLVRGFEEDEYNPEYSTLVLRDAWPPPGGTASYRPTTAGLPREYPSDSQPSGTIARAGRGWLEGSGRDAYHNVRLELHDGPPADDGGEWPDVMRVIQQCYEALAKDCNRISCTVKMDWRKGHSGRIEAKVR